MILAKIDTSCSHWEWSKSKYQNHIYNILQFVKVDKTTTHAILQPYAKNDWSNVEIKESYGPWELNPQKLIEVDISNIQIIHQSEIPEHIIRDFKLSSIGI